MSISHPSDHITLPIALMSTPVQVARVTQRAPQSCLRCSTKKIKCTMTVPCGPCINLGIPDHCEREAVVVARRTRLSKPPRRRGRPPGSLSKQVTYKKHDHDIQETLQKRNSGVRSSETIHMPTSTSECISAVSISPPVDWHLPSPETSRVEQQNGRFRLGGDYIDRSNEPPTASEEQQDESHLTSQRAASTVMTFETSSWQNNDALAENAAMTLELLTWGRQRDAGVSPTSVMSLNALTVTPEILTCRQAMVVIEFHRENLTWMHNLMHWPSFLEECHTFWSQSVVEENSWLGLYYAVLCVRSVLPVVYI